MSSESQPRQPVAATSSSLSTTTASTSTNTTTPSTRPDPSQPPAPGTFKIYRPPTALPSLPAPPPPPSDEFFNPTQADLREQQAHLNARISSLNPGSIALKKEREKQREKKIEKWPETRIRVKFPDQTQLERKFATTDKIREVYKFVRGCLSEEGKKVKFIIYQTPPKRDLKVSDPNVRDLTLYDLQLTPSSILFLRWEDEDLNHDQSPAPLLPSILEQAEDLPIPAPAPPPPPAPSKECSSTASANVKPATTGTSGSSNSAEKAARLAKLLKLGKK
ncbi:hypothetical protein FA13DRAFT_1772389 [Coprinellus micaceus]|uniref:UBX domain-containing protein n=1 Tax=Coprinellus micaceus TaxID=71717 RepID=A0A4Y7TJT3_COPMI|nr:hypothetical protein FA13DRAFT_1772389 [Coprinellus micaceus]